MWIFWVLLNLGAFYSAVSTSPSTPVNVHFSSINLRNVLHWLPGNSTTEDACFTVQYAIYGDSVNSSRGRRVNWKPVRQCTEILQNWCDLSNETWDLELWYYARVRVVTRNRSSKWATTWRRFDPKLDTVFGPPLLTVELQNNNAVITLKGPMRYRPNNDTPQVAMASLYPRMTYDLWVNNTQQNKTEVFLAVSSPHQYRQIDYNTKYCFSAKTSLVSMPVICQTSILHCITTPPDPVMEVMKMVFFGLLSILFVCVLIVGGYFSMQYLTGKGQKSPSILEKTSFQHPPLTFPPEKPNIILIAIINKQLPSEFPNSGGYKAQLKPIHGIPDPAPLYSPRRSRRPSEHDEHWDDPSVDYGTVVAVRKNSQEIVSDDGSRDSRVSNDHEAAEIRPQTMSYFPQRSNQTHLRPKETSMLVQAQPFDPEELSPRAPLLLSLRTEQEPEGLGLFQIPDQLEETTCSLINVKENEVESEDREPVVSDYASQGGPCFQTDQSDGLSDYGLLVSREEELEGSIIDWDPETRKLILPMLGKVCNLDEEIATAGEGSENVTMEEEEVKYMMSPLNLESVFVRQNSDMKETQGELEEDIIMTKWNVVISMDG